MEVLPIKQELKKDNQLLVITHLSQLLDFVTGVGGFIVPLILWLTKKDEIEGMDEHGKQILNFKISMFIYMIASVFLLIIGIGLVGLIVFGILSFIFPIINAINVSNGKKPNYPLSIEFIK